MRQLAAELPTQEQLNIDETATKEENGKAWLWTFVARMFTVFAVRATREATALAHLPGRERFTASSPAIGPRCTGTWGACSGAGHT